MKHFLKWKIKHDLGTDHGLVERAFSMAVKIFIVDCGLGINKAGGLTFVPHFK